MLFSSLNDNKYFKFYFFIVIAIYVVILWPDLSMTNWKASHWLITYEHEFVKRGLPGQILAYFKYDNISKTDITDIASVIYLLLVFLLGILFYSAFRNKIILPLVILLSGFSVQQFFNDLGRFDQINYILLIVSFFIWNRFKESGFITITFLSSIMLFVHEASALLVIPIFVSFLCVLVLESKCDKSFLVKYIAVVVTAFIGVFLNGSDGSWTRDDYFGLFKSRNPDFYIERDVIDILFYSLKDNMAYTWGYLYRFETIKSIALLALVSSPYLWLFYRLVKSLEIKNIGLFLIPVISILPMFFIGKDFSRWYASILFNIFILCAFLSVELYKGVNVSRVSYVLLGACIVVSYLFGSYGIVNALPEIRFSFGGV